MSIASTFDVLTATAAISVRPWAGVNTRPAVQKPEKMLMLYEFEGCPFCRLVREALTELDLEVLILPCPKGGTRFRPEVEARGGMTQFPYLVDPNTGLEMYESADIIEYLFEAYGGRRPGLAWQIPQPFQVISSATVGAFRPGRGINVRASKEPEEPLELWSFEARPVRPSGPRTALRNGDPLRFAQCGPQRSAGLGTAAPATTAVSRLRTHAGKPTRA